MDASFASHLPDEDERFSESMLDGLQGLVALYSFVGCRAANACDGGILDGWISV